MANPFEVTVHSALNQRLLDLDIAWDEVRAIHADLGHVNVASQEYGRAFSGLVGAINAVWRLKEMWSDVD